MADLQQFSPIQALIETWWKEQRPEGDESPAPSDLPIYTEILEFTRKKLKESRVVAGKKRDGETSSIAVGKADNLHFHVVPTDDPPVYEAQSAKLQYQQDMAKRDMSRVSTLLPVDTPFTCAGFYDYLDRKGSNTYGVFGHKPDTVAYELVMTSAGTISGTSKDTCGSATIEGTVDCETGAVELAKSYSWSNLWAHWKYQGQLEEVDGKAVILGRWESGRFAIWLNTKGIDHSEMMEAMQRRLDARDHLSRSGDCAP